VLTDSKIDPMNEDGNNQEGFMADYALLKLDTDADWKLARNQYRKLVHIWHPDKYADRPRERDHAQKQFIELTKSFNQLKDFHKLHGRLPYENASPEAPRPDAQINVSGSAIGKKSRVNTNNLDLDPLSRDENKTDDRVKKRSPLKKILWLCTASVVIFTTIGFFLVIDQKANQRNLEHAKQVLRNAPESEFKTTAAEIRRSEAKGAFIGRH